MNSHYITRQESGVFCGIINELAEMLKTHNLQAGDLMMELRHILTGRGFDMELGRLTELINRLNFKDAEEALSDLSNKIWNSIKRGPHDGI